MKTLRKLLLVALRHSSLHLVKKTYNDKLFWPGELSQNMARISKPSTLDLTYSGEKS